MQLKPTKELEQEEFEDFFDEKVPPFNEIEMKKYGYFIYKQGTPTAFFSLMPVDRDTYWLRSLIMKRSAPVLLPVTIIQTAEQLTQSYGATSLIIHSKTTVLEQLLTQLGYHLTDQALEESLQASWWITRLEDVDKNSGYTQNFN
ncbi:hypothetical protein GI584_20905 [Gracilibacillus salitolerans]|uniref:N-acetyltransferase domain-containing protein n=1 Tax=Gracilibacillus salitolerans TaxID=2663022 RepID=A0A5Q2TQL5_9BACI|nr:hypothetical protein [Gracilibacillus salitolerans]QGH36353.1 hypothetical protein GI584_20905 [Gracilibacillus salitolerans]